MPMKLFNIFVYAMIFWSALAQIAQANIVNELCPAPKEAQHCTLLFFKPGLPKENYSETLRSVTGLIVEDFIFYLTVSHGPFNHDRSPSIEYSADFYSAYLDTKNHGTIVFVVINSPTSIKPFGITAVMDNGEKSRIDISFGYSEYAVLEVGNDLFFIYIDRFSGEAQSKKFR